MVFEVPTGAFADRFGRRSSLVAGIAIRSMGLFWLFASADPLSLFAGLVLTSLGGAFVSGADSALIYDALNPGKVGDT